MTVWGAIRHLSRTTTAAVATAALITVAASAASAEPAPGSGTTPPATEHPTSEPAETVTPTTPALDLPTIPAEEPAVTLTLNVTSSRVAMLQQALDTNAITDYFAGTAAGPYTTIFDERTATAVKAWQKANGYQETGRITTQSGEWTALLAQRGPERNSATGDTLKQGSKAATVRSLQAALAANTTGTFTTAAKAGIHDTYFGPALKNALVRWQKKNGYTTNGQVKVGSKQWNALMTSQKPAAVALKTPIKLKQGTTDENVKTLQRYLDRNKSKDYQKYATNVYDTYFGSSTKSGLKALQKKLGYPADGGIDVNSMEWLHIKSQATKKRTGKGGKTLSTGVNHTSVVTLQKALDLNKKKDYFSHLGPYTTMMGPVTVSGLKAWQKANGYPQTGVIKVGSIQWGHLAAQKRKPPAPGKVKLDPRCYSSGAVVCASKKDRKVYYVKNGKILKTLDARFGGRAYDQKGRQKFYTTKEGSFTITRKVKNEISWVYGNTPMPYTAYFYGGQAFHYSYGFAREGWRGDWGSHGCINLRDWSGAEWLYNKLKIGTKVVVYK